MTPAAATRASQPSIARKASTRRYWPKEPWPGSRYQATSEEDTEAATTPLASSRNVQPDLSRYQIPRQVSKRQVGSPRHEAGHARRALRRRSSWPQGSRSRRSCSEVTARRAAVDDAFFLQTGEIISSPHDRFADSAVDHGQGLALPARRQRAGPRLRRERPVHARRRGGVHAPRRRDVRPRPAHRHGARRGRGPRARAADQLRAHAVGARGGHAGLPHAGGRAAAAAPHPPLRHRRRAGEGPASRLGRHASVLALRGAADHREGPLPRARRPDAVHRAPRADLRDARPRRGRRPGEGDPGRQRADRPPPRARGPVGELAVLAGRADRAPLLPPHGLRGLPALGPAAPLPRLRRLRAGRRTSSREPAASRTTRTSGGTSASIRGSARSRSGSATRSRGSRT